MMHKKKKTATATPDAVLTALVRDRATSAPFHPLATASETILTKVVFNLLPFCLSPCHNREQMSYIIKVRVLGLELRLGLRIGLGFGLALGLGLGEKTWCNSQVKIAPSVTIAENISR